MKWSLLIGAIAVLGAGSVYAYQQYFQHEPEAAMEFINAYSEYETLMFAEEASVYVPGQGDNASRQMLNELLKEILAENMTSLSDAARLERAQVALREVADLKQEIDTAQASHASVYAAIEAVEEQGKGLASGQLQTLSSQVVELMRERQRVTSQITALQSATNAHAEDILVRVVEAGGALPEALIIYINEGTPMAEARFDDLNRLYYELSTVRTQLDTVHAEFVAAAI
jgi:hypothetical protein